MALGIKLLATIEDAIQNLPIKKLWKINENDHKVKVRRNAEAEYSIYLDGHFITSLAECEDTFEMVKTLLES
jgi:hypothetical protein